MTRDGDFGVLTGIYAVVPSDGERPVALRGRLPVVQSTLILGQNSRFPVRQGLRCAVITFQEQIAGIFQSAVGRPRITGDAEALVFKLTGKVTVRHRTDAAENDRIGLSAMTTQFQLMVWLRFERPWIRSVRLSSRCRKSWQSVQNASGSVFAGQSPVVALAVTRWSLRRHAQAAPARGLSTVQPTRSPRSGTALGQRTAN